MRIYVLKSALRNVSLEWPEGRVTKLTIFDNYQR